MQRVIERATPPHGECKNYNNEEIMHLNAYRTEYRGIGFSTKAISLSSAIDNVINVVTKRDFHPHDLRVSPVWPVLLQRRRAAERGERLGSLHACM